MSYAPDAAKEWRALARRVHGVNDQVLRSLAATIDALENRGEADAVLEAARPRLKRLRPPRPVTFTRLLFLPLEGAIVPGARWQRGTPQLPRSALRALAEAVGHAMAEEAEALSAEARDRTLDDAEAVAALGARLWPRAATLLPAIAPPGWGAATGLRDADYAPLAALCSTVLPHAVAIHAAQAAGGEGPPDALTRAALLPFAEAKSSAALHAVLVTLLRRAALPGRVIAIAASLGPPGRAMVRPMLQAMLDQTLPAIETLDLDAAIDAVRDVAGQWRDIEDCGLLDPDQRRQLRALRHAADKAGRARLQAGCEGEVLAPLASLRTIETDAPILALEAAARGLRVLAQAVAGIGAEGHGLPERILAGFTPRLRSMRDRGSGATPMDLARLVEILDGPEAAMALLAPVPA